MQAPAWAQPRGRPPWATVRSRPVAFLAALPDAASVWVQLWAATVAVAAVPAGAMASAAPVRVGLAPGCRARAYRAWGAAVLEVGAQFEVSALALAAAVRRVRAARTSAAVRAEGLASVLQRLERASRLAADRPAPHPA